MDPFSLVIVCGVSVITLFGTIKLAFTRENLSRFQKLYYKKLIKIKKKNFKNYKDEECIICQEEFKLKDKVINLYCKHIYHKDCINTWLYSDCQQLRCPLCNLPMLTKFDNVRITDLIE